VVVARWVLPVALLALAGGILGADLRLLPSPAWLGLAGIATGVVAVVGGRIGAVALLGAVVLVAAGIGAWRQTATLVVPDGAFVAADLVDGTEYDLRGRVVDDPRPRADRLQLVLGDVIATREAGPTAVVDRILVWLPRGIDVRGGSLLAVRSRLELPEDFDGFAYREYLARQGIGAIARARAAEVLADGSGPGAVLAGLRGTLLGGLTAVIPEPEAALGAGILLGVRSSIAPEVSDAFATAGLTHVVAISGWNIAIVVALVGALLRPLERRPGGRWMTAAIASATVAAYVLLTGASPSVVRAALMAGALLVGRFSGSRAHAGSALGLAALVMLLAAPSVLWDVGFQLSLLATAGLIWYGRPIEARLARWPAWLREPVALTMAAQLTTLPVVLVNFERLSLVAPLANVLVVPIVPLVMLFSSVAAVLGIIAEAVGRIPAGDVVGWVGGGPAWLLLRAMITIGGLAASVPGAAVPVSVPASLAIAWIPVLGIATWALRDPAEPTDEREVPDEAMTGALAGLARIVRPRNACLAMVATLLVVTLASRPDGRLHVTVLDIGQGDAILVEAPSGATMLVDGGPDPELTLRRLGSALPFHVRRIDVLVVSHPHQDHVGGLVDVLDRFRVGAVVEAAIPFANPAYERLRADAARASVPVITARAGQHLALDAHTSLEILYPSEADATAPLPDGDINNGSIVALLRHGGFAVLLTGDAEAPVEEVLLSRGHLRPIDVLKVGHHGSTSSTTTALLDATRPGLAVISAGVDNEYGHPATQTLQALARPGLVTMRTDRDGDVEIVSDGTSYAARSAAGAVEDRATHAAADAGSIGAWPSPTDRPPVACSTRPGCPTASSPIPRAWLASPWQPPGWWPRLASRSTRGSWRRRLCCTTSTSWRSGATAASTASSARDGSRRRATRSSPCRSPPIRSAACSTTSGSRSAGRR
jgi:competence protein ComEC